MRVLTPIEIRGRRLRTRTAITAHGASNDFRSPLLPPDRYIEYLRRRAAGGVGLIIEQPIIVDPHSDYPVALTDRLTKVAEAVHIEGGTIVVQLCHFGASFFSDRNDIRRSPLWGFDTIQSREGDVAHKMTDSEIELMIEAFARAARVVAESGHDGVEVHGAHGYLIQQSYLPWLNQRDDKWGQDRLLFVRRVITAAREAVGPDRIVGFRVPVDDLRAVDDGGIGAAGQISVAKAMVGTGHLDYLTTSIGGSPVDYTKSIGTFRHPVGEFMPKMGDLRRGIDEAIPIIGIGRVTSLAMAESFIERGFCDIVAMTRAHIADPDVIKKTVERRGDHVRPCVGALECSSRKGAGADATCFQNPEVLRELEFAVVPASKVKRVAVVGAGPAGLKAAETLLRRGHEVTVFDDNPEPGGLLRYVRKTEAGGLYGAVEWLVAELRDRGAKLELGSRLDRRGLTTFGPDEVILATGGRPDLETVFLGAETGHVVSSTDALDGEVDNDVVVYDGMGVMEAALIAEVLAKQGKRVAYVTCFDALLQNAGFNHQVETGEILRNRCTQVIVGGVVGLLDGRTAHVVTPAGTSIAELEAGTVVAVTPLKPDLTLVPAVQSLGVPYHLIGNARAHRLAIHAFREGEEVGMLP